MNTCVATLHLAAFEACARSTAQRWKPFEATRRRAGHSRKSHIDAAISRDCLEQVVQGPIVHQLSLVDEQDALTEPLDVVHVVARQDDGDSPVRVHVREESADLDLGGCVEADRGFVEEQDLG